MPHVAPVVTAGGTNTTQRVNRTGGGGESWFGFTSEFLKVRQGRMSNRYTSSK